MSETRAESTKLQSEASEVPPTPTKSTPSKRKSRVDREREESEEIIKSMGGSVQEGGRRTRSSARGGVVPATPPPPAKKSKLDTPSRRGRAKRDIVDVEEPDTTDALAPVPETEINEVTTAADASAVDPTDTESMEVDGAICSKSTEKEDDDDVEKPGDGGDTSEPTDAEAVVENGDSTNVVAANAASSPAAPDANEAPEIVADLPAVEQTHIEPVIDKDETVVPEPEKTPAAPAVEVADEDAANDVPADNAVIVAESEPDAISVDSSNASSLDEIPKADVKVPEVALNDEPTIESSVPVAEEEVL